MTDKIPYRFPATLRTKRLDAGISQQELAARIGVDAAYLCAFEKGRRIGPEELLVRKIIEALRLSEVDGETLLSHARNDAIIKQATKLLPRPIGLFALEAVLAAANELEDKEMVGLLAHIRSLTSSKRALKQLANPAWEAEMT